MIKREAEAFREVNKRKKPKQPTKSLRELLVLSGRAEPCFDLLMQAVAKEANLGREGVARGGVLWEMAPLKKMPGIVEKICFDPQQCGKVTVPCSSEAQLDASGMLDTVRGMFTCSTMAHVDEVLRVAWARATCPNASAATALAEPKKYETVAGRLNRRCIHARAVITGSRTSASSPRTSASSPHDYVPAAAPRAVGRLNSGGKATTTQK